MLFFFFFYFSIYSLVHVPTTPDCVQAYLWCEHPWKASTFHCGQSHIESAIELLTCDSLGQIRSILKCNCITYNENTSTLEIGSCIYTCNHNKKNTSPYFYLLSNASDWNEIICGRFNRKGTLCGECKDGFYTSAYSYDLTCIKCTNTASNWLKFVLIAFLPLTVFYFVVLVLRINVHCTHLQGYVLYSQAVTVIYLARILVLMVKEDHLWFKYIIYSTGTFYGIWNLDFFRFFSADILPPNRQLGNCVSRISGCYISFVTYFNYLWNDPDVRQKSVYHSNAMETI